MSVLENAFAALSTEAKQDDAITVLGNILIELGQKLEQGQAVALDGPTLAALEAITINNPTDVSALATAALQQALLTQFQTTGGIVSTVQQKWRSDMSVQASFNTKWDITQVGAPPAVPNVAGGTLVIATGVNANDETLLTSKAMFTIPCRFQVGLALSQRIVNQEFRVEFVSCDPATGVVYPVGDVNYHQMGWMLDGATTTQGKYEVTNSGILLQSVASTITSPAALITFEGIAESDACRFAQRVLDTIGSSKVNSFRRDQNLPDPNLTYKLRIRFKNTGVPASSTNMTLAYALVNDYNELLTEVIGGQGNNESGTSIPVTVNNTTAVTSNATAMQAPSTSNTTTPAGNNLKVLSAATTNATSTKTTAGKLMSVLVGNNGAGWAYLKFYNKASAPTVGTDTPTEIIPIPPGQTVHFLPIVAIQFSTGIAWAITGGSADADTTAVAAGQVAGLMQWV